LVVLLPNIIQKAKVYGSGSVLYVGKKNFMNLIATILVSFLSMHAFILCIILLYLQSPNKLLPFVCVQKPLSVEF